MKALYSDKFVPFRAQYDKIEEYWSSLSLILKEKLLIVDDLTIVNEFLDIFKYIY